MLNHIATELIETIERLHPLSLVYCTEEPVPAFEALKDGGCSVSRGHNLRDLEKLPRFELGVIFDFLEQRSPEEGIQLLGRLRNFNCEKIWVAVETGTDWNLTTMISLGFTRVNCYVDGSKELCTYSYDIATYNHKRAWNNARYWANPENWGKYRW